jgi:arginyl-tRNA synthetase
VRCAGIFRKWAEAGNDADADKDADLSLLTHENELRFLRKSLELTEVLEKVVTTYEPHHIAFYAYELAAVFHPTYETCRVIHSQPDLDLVGPQVHLPACRGVGAGGEANPRAAR